MKKIYSNADDCYKLSKLLFDKLGYKMDINTNSYSETIEGDYRCFDNDYYQDYKEYLEDKLPFSLKYVKNNFLTLSVGNDNENHSLGHKLVVLSEFYKVLKDEFGEPTIFYTTKYNNDKTFNLQWAFNNKKEFIKNSINNKYLNNSNLSNVIVIDSYNNQNNNIGLPVELSFLVKEDIDNYIKYKKGCLKLDKEIARINTKKKLLKI